MGVQHLFKRIGLEPGAVIQDAGYNAGNVGDIVYDSCEPVAGAITPVPAGVVGWSLRAAEAYGGGGREIVSYQMRRS